MTLGRRDFLAVSGASIFGLAFIRQDDKKPTWLDEALKRAKSSGLPAIVVVVPDKHVIRVSDGLAARLRSEDAAVRDVFATAIWICIREKDASDKFKEPKRLMRVDGEGADVDLSVFEKDADFAKAARDLIERDFDKRVESAWKAVDADAVKRELARLGNDEPDVRDEASKALAGRLPAVMPILISEARASKDVEVSGRCRALIGEARGQGELPFGAEWVDDGGCGDVRADEGMIKCGMAEVPDPARKLLNFLRLKQE